MNASYTYLRLQNRVVWGGDFPLKCILIEVNIPNLSLTYHCL